MSTLQTVSETKPVATPTTPEISALIKQVRGPVDSQPTPSSTAEDHDDDSPFDDDGSSFPLPDLSALISSGSGSSIGDPSVSELTMDSLTYKSLSDRMKSGSGSSSSSSSGSGSSKAIPSLTLSKSRRSDRRRQTLMMDPDTFKQEFMRKEQLNDRKLGKDLMKRGRRASLPSLDYGKHLSAKSQLKAMYDPSVRHMFDKVDTTGLQFICKRVLLSRRKLPLQLVNEMMMASSYFRDTVMSKIISADSSLSFITGTTQSEPRGIDIGDKKLLIRAASSSAAASKPAAMIAAKSADISSDTIISTTMDPSSSKSEMMSEEEAELITADSLARLSSSDLHRIAKQRRRSKDDSALIKEKKKEVGKRLVFWVSSFISRANDLHKVIDQLNQLDEHGVDYLATNVLITKFTAEFERHDSYTSRTADNWRKVSERLKILMDPPLCEECDSIMHRKVHESVRREVSGGISGLNFWGQFRHDTMAFCECCGDKLTEDDLYFECPLCGPNAVIKVIKRGKLKKVFKRKTGSSVCVSCVRGVIKEQRRDSSRRKRNGSRIELDWRYNEGEEDLGDLLLDLEPPKRKYIPMTEYPLEEDGESPLMKDDSKSGE